MNTIVCALLVVCAVSTCTQAFSISTSFRCHIFCQERYRYCIRNECNGYTPELEQYYDGTDSEVDDCAAKCQIRLYVCPRSCGITRRGK